jgi:hypothetical protein
MASRLQEAAALEGGPAHLLDDDVLGHRHGADDAVVVAVFGMRAMPARAKARGLWRVTAAP